MAVAWTPTTFTNYMKVQYAEALRKAVMEDCVLLDMLEEAGPGDVSIGGKGFNWTVDFEHAGAAGFIGDYGNLPTARTLSSAVGAATPKECWARSAFSVRAQAAAKGSKEAIISVMEKCATDIQNGLKYAVNRACWGNKVESSGTFKTGIVGQMAAASNGGLPTATLSVDNCTPTHFYRGQLLRIGLAAAVDDDTDTCDFVKVNNITINSTTGAVSLVVEAQDSPVDTVGTDINVADDDLIVPGDSSWTAYDREFTGLSYMLQTHDDNLQSIDTGDYPQWKACVDGDNSDLQIVTRSSLNAWASGLVDMTGEVPDVLHCHSTVMRAIQDTFEGDVRYQPFESKGGFKRESMTWAVGNKMVPIIMDYFAPLYSLVAINKKAVKLAKTQDWGWLDEDGSRLSRISNKAAYEMAYGMIGELVCLNRRSLGVLRGIKTDYNIKLRV